MSIHVIDFNQAVKSAPTGKDFFHAFSKALMPFGINDISYVVIGPIHYLDSISAKDILFTTYDRAMLHQLDGLIGFVQDLTRVRAGHGMDTLWTDQSVWHNADPKQKRQYDLEYAAGIRNGYTHFLEKLGKMTASIGLRMDGLTGAEFETHWPEFSKTVLPLTQVMHSHFIKDHLRRHYHLAQREKDVLSWLVMGLRPDEIADKMCIGYRAIDKYIVSAKDKLDANSRDHAVARALSLGLLDI